MTFEISLDRSPQREALISENLVVLQLTFSLSSLYFSLYLSIFSFLNLCVSLISLSVCLPVSLSPSPLSPSFPLSSILNQNGHGASNEVPDELQASPFYFSENGDPLTSKDFKFFIKNTLIVSLPLRTSLGFIFILELIW